MELLDIARKFDIAGSPGHIQRLDSGHIHDTYALEAFGTFVKKYVLQRINHFVFKNPEVVQSNISKVLNYLDYKVGTERWEWVSDLKMIPTLEGALFFRDDEGAYWRCFVMVHNTHTLAKVSAPDQAFEGALAYGHFLARLQGFDPGQLEETIPGFRDIELRIRQLDEARANDAAGRVAKVGPEFERVESHSSIPASYLEVVNSLPVRAVHNDPKITNVLMDNTLKRGVCVIDLDTLMAGNLTTEYGDMVRSFTVTGEEDATEKEHYTCQLALFESLTRGFAKAIYENISQEEIDNLLLGAELIIYMQAIRFFADYLNGDVYYKTEYPEQNLLRTRNQLGLLDSVREQEAMLRDLIQNCFSQSPDISDSSWN